MQIDPDLEIDPRNKSILALAESHPARQTLIAQAICRRDCAGREIPWPDPGWVPVDQEWLSAVDGRKWTIAGVIYAYVSFTLILDGWISHPPHLTEDEIWALNGFPKVFALLAECEAAAVSCNNHEVVAMVAITRTFFNLWKEAIQLRIREDRLQDSNNAVGFAE